MVGRIIGGLEVLPDRICYTYYQNHYLYPKAQRSAMGIATDRSGYSFQLNNQLWIYKTLYLKIVQSYEWIEFCGKDLIKYHKEIRNCYVLTYLILTPSEIPSLMNVE